MKLIKFFLFLIPVLNIQYSFPAAVATAQAEAAAPPEVAAAAAAAATTVPFPQFPWLTQKMIDCAKEPKEVLKDKLPELNCDEDAFIKNIQGIVLRDYKNFAKILGIISVVDLHNKRTIFNKLLVKHIIFFLVDLIIQEKYYLKPLMTLLCYADPITSLDDMIFFVLNKIRGIKNEAGAIIQEEISDDLLKEKIYNEFFYDLPVFNKALQAIEECKKNELLET